MLKNTNAFKKRNMFRMKDTKRYKINIFTTEGKGEKQKRKLFKYKNI